MVFKAGFVLKHVDEHFLVDLVGWSLAYDLSDLSEPFEQVLRRPLEAELPEAVAQSFGQIQLRVQSLPEVEKLQEELSRGAGVDHGQDSLLWDPDPRETVPDLH